MAEYIKHGFQSIPHDIRTCFPNDRWSLFKVTIPGTLADVEKKGFSRKAIRQILKDEDFEDDLHTKRSIKMVPARIKSETIETANTLLSVFVTECCSRGDKVTTTMIESIETPEFKESRLNVDFSDSSLNVMSVGSCVIGVEHKNREHDPFVLCENCHGSGLVKCEHCDGSGRVRGFAEDTDYGEKERSYPCSECGGRGRVPCPYCNGEGRVAVFAREYSLFSRVEETRYYEVKGCYWTPWNVWRSPFTYHHSSYEEMRNSRDPFDRILLDLAKTAVKESFECITLRYRNRNTVEEDHRQEVKALMQSCNLEAAYNQNLEEFEKGKEDDGSLVVALREQHFVIPAKLLTINVKGQNAIKVLVCQKDDSNLQVVSSNLVWGSMSVGGFFFSSIYYALVRLGRAAYKLVVKP